MLEKDVVTNTTMTAMVTNASRLVHNGLIGATIVASGVYLHNHRQGSSTIKRTSFKHFRINPRPYSWCNPPELFRR